jgi:Peptide N-acetyl-beta-D-glucosaminyl asparaginase amidase A
VGTGVSYFSSKEFIVTSRLMTLLLCALMLSSAFGQKYTAPSTPVVGSQNTVTADPPQRRPSTKPCVVPLYSSFTFADFSGKPFSYTASCPGPWAKVILQADFSVTAGRQFDRTANIWIGGVNVYFGTTAEPSATVSRSWHVESDLTDYAPLFATNQTGEVDLGNLVDTTYTGILYGSAELDFYPVAKHQQPPTTADQVFPLSAGPNGGTVGLGNSSSVLSSTVTLPTNVERAYLDVIAQSQSGDEFWYTCVPNDVSGELQSCGGGAFRESQVTIDGTPAGVAPVYPWIYTGGIDPYLWRPIPDVSTLNFTPYRVDLTPFAGVLSNGVPHTIGITVNGANNYFSTTASLLVYEDQKSAQTTGEITKNTVGTPNPQITENLTTAADGSVTGSVTTKSSRHFTVSGYTNTSHGRVNSSVVQDINFSNVQNFNITSAVYVQDIKQNTTIASWSSSIGRHADRFAVSAQEWPLNANISLAFNADSIPQTTTIHQALRKSEAVTEDGKAPFWSVFSNTDDTADTLVFTPDFSAVLTHQDQSSSQKYYLLDSTGHCFSRSISSKDGTLTAVHDGAGCF